MNKVNTKNIFAALFLLILSFLPAVFANSDPVILLLTIIPLFISLFFSAKAYKKDGFKIAGGILFFVGLVFMVLALSYAQAAFQIIMFLGNDLGI